jgi:hypothetical protein
VFGVTNTGLESSGLLHRPAIQLGSSFIRKTRSPVSTGSNQRRSYTKGRTKIYRARNRGRSAIGGASPSPSTQPPNDADWQAPKLLNIQL